MSKLFNYMEKYTKASKFLIWREYEYFKQLLIQTDRYMSKNNHIKKYFL